MILVGPVEEQHLDAYDLEQISLSFSEMEDDFEDQDLHAFLHQMFVGAAEEETCPKSSKKPDVKIELDQKVLKSYPSISMEDIELFTPTRPKEVETVGGESLKSPKKRRGSADQDNKAAQVQPPLKRSRREITASVSESVQKEMEVTALDSDNGRKIFYRRTWTTEEDALLIDLVQKNGPKGWARLAEQIPGKSGNQLSQRWNKALDPSIKKGKWSKEEDQRLREAVEVHGQKWKLVSKLIEGRTGKQCRDRFTARLDPILQTGKWSPEEEQQVLEAYRIHGNKWATIQKMMPHRSWYTIKWKIESLTHQTSSSSSASKGP